MTESGMNYANVESLISTLEAKRSAIHSKFDDIVSTVSSELPGCYSGEAADKYTKAVDNVSTSIDTALKSIIQQLVEEANAQKTAYGNQDEEMASSLSAAESLIQ